MVSYTPQLARDSKKERGLERVLVRDIMQKGFIHFDEELDILEASKILVKKKLSGVPVLDKHGFLQGFISEKDCLRLAMDMRYHNAPPGKIKTYMSKNIISLAPDDDIFQAVELFVKHPFQGYPVVEEQRAVGLVYRHTVLKQVCKMNQSTW